MSNVIRLDVTLGAATGIVILALMEPAFAQVNFHRAKPRMFIPRPPPEIGAPPVRAVPKGEARQTERVCIEKEMCVDVPTSPPSPDARK